MIKRRDFLTRSAAAAGGIGAFPAILPWLRSRPQITSGVQCGDILSDRAIIWSRADRPARLIVDYSTRESMADARRTIGPAAIEATPTLVASLSSDDAETREAIVSALGELGTGAAPTAASAVENMLGDADPFVRVAAAGGLVGMGRAAGRERNVLLTALRSDDEELQAAAAEVVGDWGKAAAGFSAALAKIALNAKDPQARAAAVTAIGAIAAADQAATLGKALDDDDADVRHAAAYAIADLPEIVAGLEAAIVAAADDDDVRVRMEIAPTLARLGTPAAKKALDALANDEDGNVADVAKQVAGKTSVKAK